MKPKRNGEEVVAIGGFDFLFESAFFNVCLFGNNVVYLRIQRED